MSITIENLYLLLWFTRYSISAQLKNQGIFIYLFKKAAAKGTKFEFLKPGTYYLRAYMDINRNEKWDTGDISARRQPEEMFYYSKKLTLRANWEFEETWDVKAIPLLEQKPAELKKDGSKK